MEDLKNDWRTGDIYTAGEQNKVANNIIELDDRTTKQENYIQGQNLPSSSAYKYPFQDLGTFSNVADFNAVIDPLKPSNTRGFYRALVNGSNMDLEIINGGTRPIQVLRTAMTIDEDGNLRGTNFSQQTFFEYVRYIDRDSGNQWSRWEEKGGDNISELETNLFNLSDYVSYLGNFTDGETKVLSNIQNGKYIDSDGKEVSNENFSYGQLDVTNTDALRIKARSGFYATLVAWYRADNTFISSVTAPGGLAEGDVYDLYHIRPQGATIAKISYITALGCSVNVASKKYSILSKELKDEVNGVLLTRSPVQRFVNNNTYQYSGIQLDIISCIVNLDFKVSSKYADHRFAIIAFGYQTTNLEPNKQFYLWVRDLTGSDLNIPGENVVIKFNQPYEDADIIKPVQINRRTEDFYFDATIDFGKAKILRPGNGQYIWGTTSFQIIPEISDNFPLESSDLIPINNLIGDDKSSLRQYSDDLVSTISWIDGYYLNPDGKSISQLDTFRVSDFIDITDIEGIKINSKVGVGHAYLAYYKENQSVISSFRSSTNGTFEFSHEKPTNAKYARISYPNFDNPSLDIRSWTYNSILNVLGSNTTSTPLDGVKRILFIPIYGQSLSIGAESSPPISVVQKYNGLKFNVPVIYRPSNLSSFTPLVEANFETSASGTNEMFIEALGLENAFSSYEGKWNDVQLLFICPGVGGANIDQLLSESYYQYVRNSITGAKKICDEKGYTLEVPAWCWIQGENDVKDNTSEQDYTGKLIQLQEKITADVQSIVGQTSDVKCIMYQTANQSLYSQDYSYANPYLTIPTAQMKLIRDDNRFIASVPVYSLDVVPGNDIHLTNYSEKILGGYQGYALKKYLIDGVQNKGVVPLNITVSGNDILIKYNVPCPPLCFDTDYIREVDNKGFSCIKPDNSNIIDSVSLFNDTVTIHCNENPVGAKLRYALNATRKGSGRDYGSRGNLRDSQGNYIYKDIEGVKYPLHNWAYAFEEVIQ